MKKCSVLGLVVTVSLSACPGCQTSLDKKQAELIDAWGTTNTMFASAVGVYHETMSQALREHYSRVRDQENANFKAWIENQVHDGRLVLTDDRDIPILDAGKYQPMEYAALKSVFEAHEQILRKIEADQTRFFRIDADMASAIQQFKNMTELNLKDNHDIAEAKASAQQLLESSLGVIAGFAAGAVVGN